MYDRDGTSAAQGWGDEKHWHLTPPGAKLQPCSGTQEGKGTPVSFQATAAEVEGPEQCFHEMELGRGLGACEEQVLIQMPHTHSYQDLIDFLE